MVDTGIAGVEAMSDREAAPTRQQCLVSASLI
jgi:hypothetical protein